MKPSKKQIEKWVNALRSGAYRQAHDSLQRRDGYCCLGVACDVFIPKRKLTLKEDGILYGGMPEKQEFAPSWLVGINEDFRRRTDFALVDMNDGGFLFRPGTNVSFTFDEIADMLELVYIHEAFK